MTLEEQVRYVEAHLERAVVASQPDGIYVIRWPFELSEPWTPGATTLVVLVPPHFPAQAPSGFDTVGAVTRAGSNPAGGGMRAMGTEQWMHFCWNPASTIDYTAEDALWRFAKFAESRFLTLQ